MSMSLREQLLQAGFGTKKQAQEAEQQERARQQQSARGAQQRNDRLRNEQIRRDKYRDEQRKKEQERVAQAQAAKAARQAELQRRRQEEADRKERWTKIKQLIEQHRLPKVESDEYFNFISRGKVRRLAVDALLRERIVAGELVIVRCEGRHDVVPRDIAESIRGYDARAVVTFGSDAESAAEPAADDPYKDYVVPDDLRW
jgi:uncharacterized protein